MATATLPRPVASLLISRATAAGPTHRPAPGVPHEVLQRLVEHAATTVAGTVSEHAGLEGWRGQGYPCVEVATAAMSN